MSNHRTIHTRLGTALVTALVCVTGSACVEGWKSVDEEVTGKAHQADVTLYPPGTTFDCTIRGVGPAGRVWATLTVGEDRLTCYQKRATNRIDPASERAVSCKVFGRNIGCGRIARVKPDPVEPEPVEPKPLEPEP